MMSLWRLDRHTPKCTGTICADVSAEMEKIMENYRLFIRSMKVMGRRLCIYLGAVFVMSVSISMFSIMGSMLMKSVVDISQSGEYQRLSVAQD